MLQIQNLRDRAYQKKIIVNTREKCQTLMTIALNNAGIPTFTDLGRSRDLSKKRRGSF
jgi:hypothetical protein